MKTPKILDNEADRLAALGRYEILDTLPEEAFDGLARLAAHVCQTPIALVSLSDSDRQWFKACVGLDIAETPRELSFCAHTLARAQFFCVEDASQDERFADNPLVVGAPHIRFYAGAPLVTRDGYSLGALCVIDREPRVLDAAQIEMLELLAQQVMTLIEARAAPLETALRDAQDRYRAIAENALDLVAEVDAAGAIVFLSPNFERGLGYQSEELKGRSIFELIHIDDQETASSSFAALQEKGACYCGPLRFRAKDGTWRWMEISAQRFASPDRTQHAITVWRDVTEERASELRYSLLVENAPIGIIAFGRDGRVEEVNAALLQLLGAPSADAMLGRDAFELPFARLEMAHKLLSGKLSDRDTVVFEEAWTSAWGKEIHARMNVVSRRDAAGEFDGFEAILEDISPEREFREAVELNQAVLDAALDAVATIDERGIVHSANPALERLFGYEAEEVIGQNIGMLMPEPYSSEHDGYLQRYLATGEKQIVGIGREVRGLGKDGSEFPIYLTVSEARPDGRRLFTGNMRDLSDAKSAEEDRASLGRILEDSRTEIFVFNDETLRFRLVNRGARENLGYSLDELRTMTPVDLKPELTWDDFQETIAPLRNGESPKVEFRTVHRRKDGSDYLVDVHIQHDAVHGEFLAMILDVTEREQLEQQLLQAQKMEAIGTLAGGVAHDFNNLLTSILGSSEVLLDNLDDESRLVRAARRIKMAAERGAGLTSQLLAFSRKQVTQPERIELNQAVENCRELFIRMIGEDVEVKLDLDPNAGAIRFDRSQLDQVIINLVVNARDAMPSGGSLRLRTRLAEVRGADATRLGLSSGIYATLCVEDTGIGMSASTIAQIFDPFFTTKEPGKGTGLGLATVHGIMERQEGTITVDSRIDEGTTFALYFPSVGSTGELQVDASAEVEPMDAMGKAILVVEDDSFLRDLMSEVLEMEGFEVLTAEDPESGLRLATLRGGGIDLLITDVVMPQMDGFELANQLVSRSDRIKVLFMSGYTDQVLADRGQLAPDDAFLRKPFGNDQLLEKVREVLSGSS